MDGRVVDALERCPQTPVRRRKLAGRDADTPAGPGLDVGNGPALVREVLPDMLLLDRRAQLHVDKARKSDESRLAFLPALTTEATYVANEDKGPLNAVGLDLGDGLLDLLAELRNPACLVALG